MSKKNTQNLIQQLAAQSDAPVRKMRHPAVVGAFLSVFSGLFVMSSVALLGMRTDIAAMLHMPLFGLEVILALLTGVFGMFAANWLAIPDMRQQRWVCWLPFITFAGLTAIILRRYFVMPTDAFTPIGIGHCFPAVVLVAMVPAIVLVIHMRRMATVHGRLAAVVAFLSALSFGYIPARVMCPVDEFSHLLTNHLGPLLLAIPLGMFLGYRLFRW
ncbi:MAG: DUF1109 family protein [Proteobacteria bacterium]|nr:DUF1109 family protein [Pseudomonadota bacterium]